MLLSGVQLLDSAAFRGDCEKPETCHPGAAGVTLNPCQIQDAFQVKSPDEAIS